MCYSPLGWIISGILFMMWKKIEENEEAEDFCGIWMEEGRSRERWELIFLFKIKLYILMTIDGIVVFFYLFGCCLNGPIA